MFLLVASFSDCSNLLKHKEKCISKWPEHLSSTRAKLAVIIRISSYSLPQRAMYFSEGTELVFRFGPTPEQRSAAFALLKTRNRLIRLRWERPPAAAPSGDRARPPYAPALRPGDPAPRRGHLRQRVRGRGFPPQHAGPPTARPRGATLARPRVLGPETRRAWPSALAPAHGAVRRARRVA